VSSLEFSHVTFGYNKNKPVLKDLSFKITSGQILGVLGPNGSGKTTLLKLANGLIRPQTGAIFLNGFDIKNKKTSQLAQHIAVSSQFARQEFFSSTVYQELMTTASLYFPDSSFRKEVVAGLLKSFGLEDLSKSHPYVLSSGEQRRLSLAIAFTIPASFYLFDEPTANADHVVIELLHSYLLDLKNKGHSFIVVSHDSEFLFSICDRLLVLKDGAIEFQGTPTALIHFLTGKDWDFLEIPSVYSFLQQLHREFGLSNILSEYLNNKTRQSRLEFLISVMEGLVK